MKLIENLKYYFKLKNKRDWIYILILFYIFAILFNYIKDYSIDIIGWEFAFINHVQLIKKFNTLYLNPDQFPFTTVYYPPLYPYTIERICKIYHVDVFKYMHEILVKLRYTSFLFTLGSSYLLIKTISIFTSNKKYTLFLLILLYLLLPLHIFAARPDAIKLFLFLLFFKKILTYLFIERKSTTLIYACIYATIGIFFKHDILLYILPFFFVHYLIYGDKNIFIGLLVFSGFSFTLFFLFNHSFGNIFLKNIIYYNIQYSSDIKINLYFIAINLIRLSPFIYISVLNTKNENKNIKFISWLSITYLIISSFSLLRVGSNLNYTYETIFLFLINFGIYIQSNPLKHNYYEYLLIIFLYLTNFYLKGKMVNNIPLQEVRKSEYLNNLQTSIKLKQTIGNDTTFFTNGKYILFYADLNIIYGYDLHFDRFFDLYENIKMVPSNQEHNTIKEYDRFFQTGSVKYIVVEHNAKAVKQIDKYYKNYYFYKKVNNLLLFKYKPVCL